MLQPNRMPYAALTGLAATAALILMTELLPVGVLAPMRVSLGVSQGRVGFLASAYAAAATVSAIPLTALTRRLPRRPLLIGVVAGFALGNAVTATGSSYAVVLAVRVVVGLLGGLAWSMIAGYAAGIAPAARRGRAVAIALAGITVALVAGLPAGSALGGQFGWRAPFFGLTAVAAVLVGWLVATLPRPSTGTDTGGPGLRVVARRPGVGPVLAVTGLLLLGHQAAYTFLSLLARRGGVDRPGTVLLVFGLSALAGIWLTGVLVDQQLRVVALGALGLVVAALLTVAVAGPRPVAMVVAVAVWGGAFGGLPTALQAALVRTAGVGAAMAAGSLQTTVYNVGVAAGSLAGGLVVDGPGVAVLAWCAAAPVVAAAVLATGSRTAFRGGAGPPSGSGHRVVELEPGHDATHAQHIEEEPARATGSDRDVRRQGGDEAGDSDVAEGQPRGVDDDLPSHDRKLGRDHRQLRLDAQVDLAAQPDHEVVAVRHADDPPGR